MLLQQARNVVSYDLPWNPMRVVQRNGRIDRINSPHPEIYPFFPEDCLDELLQLELRVRRKLVQAARSIGMANEVIPGMETMEQNYADREVDIRSLHDEEPDLFEQGGKEAAAYSGEEYRQVLREGLEDREEQITGLPWGAGSGLRGEHPGHFFCARVGDEVFVRFVPLEWDEEEDLVGDTPTCLKRIECSSDTDRHLPDDLREGVYDAWAVAREDVYEQWQRQTDPAEVQPDIPRLFREVGQHLREHWPQEQGYTQDKLQETVSAVEAPRGQRYVREIREVFEDDSLGPVEKSREIVATVEDLGLQPFDAPEPLSPIYEDEVKLVCWMAVAPRDGAEDRESSGLVSQTTLDSH